MQIRLGTLEDTGRCGRWLFIRLPLAGGTPVVVVPLLRLSMPATRQKIRPVVTDQLRAKREAGSGPGTGQRPRRLGFTLVHEARGWRVLGIIHDRPGYPPERVD